MDSKRDDSNKKCDCRKSLYIYDHGKKALGVCQGPVQEGVVKLVRQMMDERDPVKKAVCRVQEEERLKGWRRVGHFRRDGGLN